VSMLPPSVSVYFPRILERTPFGNHGMDSVTSEYYGYPSVAEYFLYWDLNTDNWTRIFSRFKLILERFKSYPYSVGAKAFYDFYIEKTNMRVEHYLSSLDRGVRNALSSETIINGQICRPYHDICEELASRLKKMYRDQDFCLMHGDFCFSNILYDVPSGIVRLVDPRGSFGDGCVGVYGDQKYDLAKLKHSAEYGYDLIVNGLYKKNISGSQINYELATRECSSLVKKLSIDLVNELGYKKEEIDLLTSLLFLSMPLLHSEDTSRQIVMFAHGLKLLNTTLEN